MRIYKDVAEAARQNDGDSVVALGFFDGVHRAHAAVLKAARAEADRRALPLFVLTFRGDDAPKGGAPLLTSDEERLALFAAMGADAAVLSPFSSLSYLSPEAFVTSVLLGTLSARVAVTGENFRFGYRAAGDAARLSHLMNEGGGEAIALPPVLYGGAPISSTRVRAALADGDCALAEALLGRPYALTLPVVRGEARGAGLGFPTANQRPPEGRALPLAGVYRTRVTLPSGAVAYGVTDVGTRPTVGGCEVRCETHVLDFSGDLYGAPLTVEFLARLRGEVKFSSLSELSERIRKDCEEVRVWRSQNGTN